MSSFSEAHDALSLYPTVIMEPVIKGDVPYTVLHPNIPTSLEDLQKGWMQIKEERDIFEA